MDRVCHVSLRAGMCSPDKLSNVTLSMSPTQKDERPHETRVRRTILTTRNTDTSENSFIHSQRAHAVRNAVQGATCAH